MKHLKTVQFWGASTAAHQVEGGNDNQWTRWEKTHAKALAAKAHETYGHLKNWDDIKAQATLEENYISGESSDHYNRFEADFDLMKKLNMNAYRFSIEWSRIEPKEGQWDMDQIAYYRHYIRALKVRGIEPMMTLWHWTSPVWFNKKGGFERRGNIKHFERFCKKVVEELGSELTYIFILNEPSVYSLVSYLDGRWPPNDHSPVMYWRVTNNLVRAHKRVYTAAKELRPTLQIGTAKQVGHFEGRGVIGSVIARFMEHEWNDRWLNHVKRHTDFIGFNYYFTDVIKGFKRMPPQGAVNDLGWDMQPGNIEFVAERLSKRYKLPLIVTENGLADGTDAHRKWWIEETFAGLDRAIAKGVRLKGYLHWSLLDNFEWADGYWPRFGLIAVNYKTKKRTIRKSATWYGKQIAGFQKHFKA